MKVKCIGIGNRIMGDDSIGIRVAEEILQQLRQENIEVIFGETDIDYALSNIEEGDYIFILDSTYFDIPPATVTFTPLQEVIQQQSSIYSQHQPSIINLIKIYRKKVKGYVIGIEVEEIRFGIELSNSLKTSLFRICEEVYDFIHHTIRGINHA